MAEEEQARELSFIGEKQFQIRRVWNTEREEWFYSITDVTGLFGKNMSSNRRCLTKQMRVNRSE